MPKSKPRRAVRREKARRALREQQSSQSARRSPRQELARRVTGWILIASGVLVVATHLIEHAGFLSVLPKGLDGIYYPGAALLLIVGVIRLTS